MSQQLPVLAFCKYEVKYTKLKASKEVYTKAF